MNEKKRYKKTIAQLKRHRTTQLAKLVSRAWSLNRKGDRNGMTSAVCDEFVSLGGVYIKFLQGVLLRSQAMRNWQTADRLKIFENLDWEPIDIRSLLMKELGPTKINEISLIQPEPFAAGSFGQVYFGQLKDGTNIVIKVLRPMVRETLPYDLKLLGIFMKNFASKFYPNMQMDTKGMVADFRKATLRETDYIAEADFAIEMYENYKDHPKFKIPKTYKELCTAHMIVQEYMTGLSVAQLVKLSEQGVDPKIYVQEQLGSDLDVQLVTLGYETLYGAFKYRRVMGDPHPGNIRLLPNNQVGLIDFGISAASPSKRESFYNMLKEYDKLYDGKQDVASLFGGFIRFFVNDLYVALKKISTLLPGGGDVDLTKEVGLIAEKTFQKEMPGADFGKMAEDGSILKLVNRVVNKDNRFGLVMKIEETEILRTTQTYMTLVEVLGRRVEVMPTVFRSVLDQVVMEYPELEHEQDQQVSVSSALNTISNWLERIAERDPALFTQLRDKLRLKKVEELKEKKPDA